MDISNKTKKECKNDINKDDYAEYQKKKKSNLASKVGLVFAAIFGILSVVFFRVGALEAGKWGVIGGVFGVALTYVLLACKGWAFSSIVAQQKKGPSSRLGKFVIMMVVVILVVAIGSAFIF